MPLFEYRCTNCQQEFELLVRAAEQPACPCCGASSVDKLLSAASVPAARANEGLPIASSCPPGDAPCGPMCCRLP